MTSHARPPERRLRSDADYRALKKATASLMRDNGSAESFARQTRGCGQTLLNYASHAHAAFMPADVIADAELDAERPWVTEALARLAGYMLVPRPETVGATGADYAALKETGEAITAIAEALSKGGRIDRTEAVGVVREVREAIASLLALETAIAARYPELGDGLQIPSSRSASHPAGDVPPMGADGQSPLQPSTGLGGEHGE
ncbi:MAG: phage regulatory CII family protein [Caulobacterales bacterium]|uniref:phage regulatory CII family protein n=1 Tax=Glycocaulis sp. TaxID=1969725 RepID=UPI003F9F712B